MRGGCVGRVCAIILMLHPLAVAPFTARSMNLFAAPALRRCSFATKGADGYRARHAVRIHASADAEAMASCAKALALAGAEAVAAAAILGENQCTDEDPASLSAGGCAFSNAGRDAERVALALGDRSWEDATGPLSDCASCFYQAAASLSSFGDPPVGVALGEAGVELEDAASVTGCIVLAAAAGPAMVSAGDFLASAGGAMGAHGLAMKKGGGVYTEAGDKLYQAGAALAEAGDCMERSGMAIEAGVR